MNGNHSSFLLCFCLEWIQCHGHVLFGCSTATCILVGSGLILTEPFSGNGDNVPNLFFGTLLTEIFVLSLIAMFISVLLMPGW